MSGPGDLVVSGGAGSFGADLDDVDRAVAVLRRSAAALGEAGSALVGSGAVLQAVDGVLTDPGAALRLQAEVEAAVAELEATAASARGLAEAAAFCVGAYRTADDVGRHRWSIAGALLGGPTWLYYGLPLTAALPVLSRLVAQDPEELERGAAPQDVSALPPPGQGAVLGPPSSAPASGAPGRALPALPTTADPQLVPPPGSPLPVAPGRPPAGAPAASGASRLPEPDGLTQLGRVLGHHEESLIGLLTGALAGPGAVVVPAVPLLALRTVASASSQGVGKSTDTTVVPSAVPPQVASAGPPRGVGDAVRRAGQVSDGPGPTRIRVERITHADGTRAAVVYLPGVQDWGMGSQAPASADAALRGVAGVPSAYTGAVVEAMEQAGVERDEPVMLIGYSLGGIASAQLAADPSVNARFDVQGLLTAGSPIGEVEVPPQVHALSLEHTEDLVPQLEGVRNSGLHGGQATVVATAPDASASAHDSGAYGLTGDRVDASTEPGIVGFKGGASPFFAQPGDTSQVTEYVATRVGP